MEHKCLHRFTLRTGNSTLGYVGCIIYGSAIVFFSCQLAFQPSQITRIYNQGHIESTVTINVDKEVTARFLMIFCMLFSFSTTLIYGIHKNKPSLVRAYFLQGVLLMIALGCLIITVMPMDPEIGFSLLGGGIIYSLTLHMVRLTYEEMRSSPIIPF